MIPQPAKGQKIPYLDGLRAYSILLVLFDHTILSNSWLRPKWYLRLFIADSALGVRVFFVLSGFLITTLLLNEQSATGRISIRGFYERRIARIFPAFYLYFATIALLTALHVMDVSKASFYAAGTFTWNFATFWRHGAHGDNNVVFGHTWTLSIEEQFYLLWPSILVLFGKRWALRLAASCIAVLPVLRMIAFYKFHDGLLRDAILSRTAQDSIMWGCLGAIALRSGVLDRFFAHRFRFVYPWISALTFFGIGPILGNYPRLGMDAYLLPSMQALSTLLLMFWLLTGQGGALRRGLESWPAVQLGLLSYSLYIWQQLFTQWKGMAWLYFPWNILLPLVVAIVSYRLVEVPMRKVIRQWFSQSQPAH